MTDKTFEEAYVILKEEVDIHGNRLPYTNILAYAPTLDVSIDVGEYYLPLKTKILKFDTLSADQLWGTLILLQTTHYRKISNGIDDEDDEDNDGS